MAETKLWCRSPVRIVAVGDMMITVGILSSLVFGIPYLLNLPNKTEGVCLPVPALPKNIDMKRPWPGFFFELVKWVVKFFAAAALLKATERKTEIMDKYELAKIWFIANGSMVLVEAVFHYNLVFEFTQLWLADTSATFLAMVMVIVFIIELKRGITRATMDETGPAVENGGSIMVELGDLRYP